MYAQRGRGKPDDTRGSLDEHELGRQLHLGLLYRIEGNLPSAVSVTISWRQMVSKASESNRIVIHVSSHFQSDTRPSEAGALDALGLEQVRVIE
jgi:hypothetical protein